MLILRAFDPVDWLMVCSWAFIFIVTLVIELETSNLTTIWFCVGSVVALVFGAIFGLPFVQIVVFLVVSLVLILVTRPLTKKMMQKDIIKTNADRLVGMIAVVTKEIEVGEVGEVKVENSQWRAVNNENLAFAVGEKVSVDAILGNKLVVSKISGPTNVEIV